MMRFLCSLIVTVALFGGVGLCQYALTHRVDLSLARAAETHGHSDDPVDDSAAHRYTVSVTVGFTAGDDPFAVRTTVDGPTPRLVVQHGDTALYASAAELVAGREVTITNLAFTGERIALFVEAMPGPDDARRPCPLRIRLLRDGELCDSATLWSEGDGSRISGEIELRLVPALATLDRGLGAR